MRIQNRTDGTKGIFCHDCRIRNNGTLVQHPVITLLYQIITKRTDINRPADQIKLLIWILRLDNNRILSKDFVRTIVSYGYAVNAAPALNDYLVVNPFGNAAVDIKIARTVKLSDLQRFITDGNQINRAVFHLQIFNGRTSPQVNGPAVGQPRISGQAAALVQNGLHPVNRQIFHFGIAEDIYSSAQTVNRIGRRINV